MTRLDEIVSRNIRKFLVSEVNDIYNGNGILSDRNCPFLNKEFDNGFKISDMLSYENASDRIRYAESKLENIGSGKRRTAFKLNDNYVLKLTNGNHRWQTKNEYDTELLMSGRFPLFPRVIYQSEDFTWTISERARPLRNGDCERIIGMPMYSNGYDEPSLEGFQLWAETKGRGMSNQSARRLNDMPDDDVCAYYERLSKTNPWFKALLGLETHQRNDIDYGTDLNTDDDGFRGENLGVVNRDGKDTIVLLDSGFIKPFSIRHAIKAKGMEKPFY